jgi:hypothetical protein
MHQEDSLQSIRIEVPRELNQLQLVGVRGIRVHHLDLRPQT